MRAFLKRSVRALDIPLGLFLAIPLLAAKLVRRMGVDHFRFVSRIFDAVGVFPIRDHYHEPPFKIPFNPALSENRRLPGISFNLAAARELLAKLRYQADLHAAISRQSGPVKFTWENQSFVQGDADLLYGLIRHVKPRKIVEVGSGFSTLIVTLGVEDNQAADRNYKCSITCIEPYEMPWLESLPLTVIRKPVQQIGPDFFAGLAAGDMLFIDSSHVIKPQGDVLFEIFDILPRLAPGVLVHVHDIFSPRDYPKKWVVDEKRFWNEQYLLEGFLAYNSTFDIILPANNLYHDSNSDLLAACISLNPDREPSSFWLKKKVVLS